MPVKQRTEPVARVCLWGNTAFAHIHNVPQVFWGLKKRGDFCTEPGAPAISKKSAEIWSHLPNLPVQREYEISGGVFQRSHFDSELSLTIHFTKVVFSRFHLKQTDVIVLFLPSL